MEKGVRDNQLGSCHIGPAESLGGQWAWGAGTREAESVGFKAVWHEQGGRKGLRMALIVLPRTPPPFSWHLSDVSGHDSALQLGCPSAQAYKENKGGF